jgi:AraC-like DNA-binding protein
MTDIDVLTFGDPDGYAAQFGDMRADFTITGSGDFAARLTRLRLQDLEIYRCHESRARIAYITLPSEQIFVSFPIGMAAALMSDGFALQNGDLVLHGRHERTHQRSNGGCHWGVISLSSERLASCSKALTGRPVASPPAGKILRPARGDVSRFQYLFAQACLLAESKHKLIERPEVARALEQEMLHAIVNCLIADEVSDSSKTRYQHAEVMVRFEETLDRCINQKLSMTVLCTELGVPQRTLRMCCAEILGVSPMRYLLLRRLNRVRWALRRANPSTASVAEIARNYQFLELGRFAVTYRTTFGELPSGSLNRDADNRRKSTSTGRHHS